MRHRRDVLHDDRAHVQLGGGVVRGGADELHAALLRAVVRLRALERGQERVVDVDRVRRVPVAEPVR